MKVITDFVPVSTKGNSDIVDITPQIWDILKASTLQEGQLTVFASGSTAGITTIEYEPGLMKDIPAALDKIAPAGATYHHDMTWHDGNGHAHVRAALVGASLAVPFSKGALLLGTWQQIVVIDFDNRSRNRKIAVQLIGE